VDQWLHSLLPHLPRFSWLFVFVVVFLNNLGIPLPGRVTLLGAGFILGKNFISLWQPLAAGTAASFLGGTLIFWLGRHFGHKRIKKIRWLALTPERIKWGERIFKRHGSGAVFIARFILLLPPAFANLLAGMAEMKWATFLFYNFAGSAAYTVSFILVGYFFGQKWNALEAWLGPTALDLIAGGIALVVLGVVFRHPLGDFWSRLFSKKRKRKKGLK
jgi:membrane protein DedA with SNARE-associated domain